MRFFKKCGMNNIKDYEAKNIIKRLDVDKDGKVSLGDFKVFFPISKKNEKAWQESLTSNTILENKSIDYGGIEKNKSFLDSYIKDLRDKNIFIHESTESNFNKYNPFKNQQKQKNSFSEELLINYFIDIINKESDLDRIRVELALRPDFNFVDAFKIFENTRHRGMLDCEDIKRGYKCFGMNCNNDQILLIFQRYSKNKNYLE